MLKQHLSNQVFLPTPSTRKKDTYASFFANEGWRGSLSLRAEFTRCSLLNRTLGGGVHLILTSGRSLTPLPITCFLWDASRPNPVVDMS